MRPDAVEVKDTWHVNGMVATGSRDIVARAVAVPERYVSLRELPATSISSPSSVDVRCSTPNSPLHR